MIKPLRFPALQSRLRYFFLLPLLICLYGCPFSSSYKLDVRSAEYADDQLVGNWATMVTTQWKRRPVKWASVKTIWNIPSILQVIFTTWSLWIVTQDSIKCNAYISNASGFRAQYQHTGTDLYCWIYFKDNRLSVLPLAENLQQNLSAPIQTSQRSWNSILKPGWNLFMMKPFAWERWFG